MTRQRGICWTAGIAAGVLLFSGCTGHSGKAASGPRSPSVKPVSVQEYRTALTTALDPLDSALKKLKPVKGYKGLGTRITAVEKAAAQAITGLGRVTPPAAVAAEHSQLVKALQTFHENVGDVGTKVDDRNTCTGPVARAELGGAGGVASLRTAMKALLAKLPGERLSLALPSGDLKATKRPANGHFVRSRGRGGRGTISIDNGRSDDAVVTLAKHGKPTIVVYVRKHKKFTVTGVSDGSYEVFFTVGTDWDRQARAFGHGCSAFERFDDSLRFRTTVTATRIRWTTWKITLQAVADGNAKTSEVDPDDFPTD